MVIDSATLAELEACGKKLLDAWRERDRYRETLLAVRSMVDADVQDYIDQRLEAIQDGIDGIGS